MSEKKQVPGAGGNEVIVDKAKDFWTRNSRVILGVGTILVLLVGGFYVYQHFFKAPKEEKAADEIDGDGEKADEQTISLHETAIEHLRMRGRQPLTVGGVENEAGRHQAAPRPNSKD